MNTPLVLIAGAGPTGMAMAIELKRAGLNVRIIDQSNHLALHSQALVIQARTLEQFQRYGVAEKAVERGRKIRKVNFWSEGKNILAFDLGRIPSRYPFALLLPQNETETILNDLMQSLGVKTERATELLSFTQHNDGVHSIVRRSDGSEEEVDSRWIVGCDGAHSTVRKLAAIPFQGAGVGLSFFLGDVEIDGPDAPTDELSLFLHKGDVVFMAKLPEKYTRLIVVLHSGQNGSSEKELTIEDFQAAVDRAKVRVKIHSAGWMTPFNVHDRQATHYRQNNAFLVGDAAHIHSPVGGQGMNTGIQDAANLAWKLASVARGADERLLESYEEERAAVGRHLLSRTERGLKLATSSNPIVEHVRDLLAPLISKSTTAQDMTVGFISETAIEYRTSSLVADFGGDGQLRAGDRLPDLDIRTSGRPSTLLGDWTDARHLILLINVPDAQSRAIPLDVDQTKFVSLSPDDLDDSAQRLLGTEPKVLIVRPDGYVGFRGPVSKAAELSAYLRQDRLDASAVATGATG